MDDQHNEPAGADPRDTLNHAVASAAVAGAEAQAAPFEPGPLPAPERRYLRKSAYWADRWLHVTHP